MGFAFLIDGIVFERKVFAAVHRRAGGTSGSGGTGRQCAPASAQTARDAVRRLVRLVRLVRFGLAVTHGGLRRRSAGKLVRAAPGTKHQRRPELGPAVRTLQWTGIVSTRFVEHRQSYGFDGV
ncbi:hypothetical protein [Paraburkholderia caballeronis]|uniref:hypothetical protein n=1 Tax=Paraburkholderia caballeronis TaxID=416943 RepID=UPI0010652DA6|nr:hypothetical protein [Paraburkholderia caballeronis]